MGIKLKTIYIILLLFLLNIGYVHAIEEEELFNPPEIKNGMTLTIVDCVSTAFKNSPKIKRQKYNLDIANSNYGIAKSRYFPVISAGTGFYNENNSNNAYYNSHYRELPSVGIAVNKLIWDFGKTTSYIKMEEFYKIGAEYEFMDSLCSTLFEVKEKYYKLLRAKALLTVAKNNIEINENFVSLAQNKNKADLTTARLNLSDAKVKYIESKNNYKNAVIDLNNSMYLSNQPDYTISDTKTFSYNNEFAYNSNKTEIYNQFEVQKFEFPIKEAVDIAYENSPDLYVLISTKNAMEQSLSYIKKTYLPELVLNSGYKFNNNNYYSNSDFHVGVNLESTVNLQELKHSIKGADAQLKLADNEISLFKKDLYFEVKRAFNNVEKAENQIETSKLATTQALDNLKLVEEQYRANELNYIALQDARKDYITALNKYIDCLYEYNIALIQVEMALHYHIADIHHKSEHAMKYHSAELLEHLNKVLGCDEKEIPNKRKNKRTNL